MKTIKKHSIILITILLWSYVSVFAGEVRVVHFLKDSYASGERTVKSSGENAAMFVNAEFAGGTTNTAKFSLYVSPYLVANQGGRYTKHIYIGSQRIVSKLGDLKSYGADPRRIEYAGSESDGPKVDYKTKYALQQQVIKDNFAHFDVPYNGADNNDYVDGKGFSELDGSLEGAMMKAASLKDNFQQSDSYEQYQYFYHPDHLGSSSFITNTEGEVVQHIEYVPYGEVFIEERNNVWNTPYLFNAKEFDEETGLYYYGARYYDPRLAMWYGVDALTEKYPNIGGYVYCAGNPVMYIDPDGNIKIRFKVGFSMNSGIVGAGFKFLGLKYIFDGAKEININVSISYDTEQNQLYIGSERAETTFTEGDLSIAGLYGASDTRQKNSSDEVVVGFDFDENAFFSDYNTENEKISHRVEEGTIGLYNYKVDDTKKSEMSISTDAHIDAVLVGVKVEAGLYIEDANQ